MTERSGRTSTELRPVDMRRGTAPHAEGSCTIRFGRTEVLCQRPGQTCTMKRKPSEYLRQNILADTMVFSTEGLRHLVAEMGASQVVFDTRSEWFACQEIHLPRQPTIVILPCGREAATPGEFERSESTRIVVAAIDRN